MPIFEQGYQHWQGKLTGRGWRWLAITRQGVRVQMKSRWTMLVLLLSVAPAIVLATFFILWGLLERKVEVGMAIVDIFRLPRQVGQDPQAFRTATWTIAYHFFFDYQSFIAMVLVLFVGPGLISQDLRFNAIPLYFSRPLNRFEYFAG